MNLRKITAAVLSLGMLLTIPSTSIIHASAKSFSSIMADESDAIGLAPEAMDMGGAAAISFNYQGREYSHNVYYNNNGKIIKVKPQANGFAYISDIAPGIYSGYVECTNGVKKYTAPFKMNIHEKSAPLVQLKSYDDNKLTITWTDFARDQSYLIYRLTEDETWKKIGETSSTTVTDKNREPGMPYTYMVTVDGRVGAINIDEAVLTAYTTLPASEEIEIDEKNNELEWDDVDPADGYIIYKAQVGRYVKIDTVEDITSYDRSDDPQGVYGVSAYITNSDGSITEGKMASTGIVFEDEGTELPEKPVSLPPRPENLIADRGEDEAYLTWDKAADNAKYAVYMSDIKNGKYVLKGMVKTTQCTVSNLDPDKTYYFKVKYATDDYESGFSDVFTIMASRTKTIKKQTTMVSGSAWASDKLCMLKKGTSVKITGSTGNFYRVSYNGRKGFIYNLAVDEKTYNVKSSKVTAKNFNTYLDDTIYNEGLGAKNLWLHINSFVYNEEKADKNINSLDDLMNKRTTLAVNLVRSKSGVSYHYAAYSAALLDRAGYSVRLVYCPLDKGGVHYYNMVRIGDDWKIFDGCRHATTNNVGYLPTRSTYYTKRKLNHSKEEISSIL